MKRFSNLLFLGFSFFFVCCNQEGSGALAFKKYIANVFHIPIQKERHYYFLVPTTQCRMCNIYRGSRFPFYLNQKITIITSFPPSNFLKFQHVLEDTTNTLESLPFVDYSNKIVVTEGGKVKSISLVYDFYKQIDSLDKIQF